MFWIPLVPASSRKKFKRMQTSTTVFDRYDDALMAYRLCAMDAKVWEKLHSEAGWSKKYAETQIGRQPIRYTNVLKVHHAMGDCLHRSLTSTRFGSQRRSVLQYALLYPLPSEAFDINLLAVDTNSARLGNVRDEYAKRGYEGEILWWRSYGEGPIRLELDTEYLIDKLWSENGKDSSSIRRGDDTTSTVSDQN